MSLKKNILGLFVLTFFISGIGLGLLVLDDQNDLSSRASTGLVGPLRPALPEEKLIQDSSVWDGEPFGLPVELTYNKLLWTAPIDKDPVFVYEKTPATVRVMNEKIDLPKLKILLGDNFSSSKTLGSPQTYLNSWETQSYTFQFFGSPRIVDVWSSGSGISLISVFADESVRGDVQDLIAGVSSPSKVKGITSPDDSARLAALIRPSVVMLLNNYCAGIRFNSTALTLPAKSYPFCLTQAGTGFFVNKDGYIATNGHVVTNIPESTLTLAVLSGALDNVLIDYTQALLSSKTTLPVDRQMVEQKIKEAHGSTETLYQLASVLSDLFKNNTLKIENSENHFYVQLGNTPMQLTTSGVVTGPDIVSATFVDADYQIPDPVAGFSSSDVALIKVAGTDYPALPLAKPDENVVGSDIVVVGFPKISMGDSTLLLDPSAKAEPTFTRGLISAFKQARGDKKILIQTDAAINHGNSGGPAVSSKGSVVGIATYGITQDTGLGSYNFLRDIADLRALMVKNNIAEDTGSTLSVWKSGLDNYWISYLKLAKSDFEKLKQLYPQHPTVDKYLADANSKIGTPEDKTPILSRAERRLYMNISGGVMAFSVLAIIILTVSDFIDSKRRRMPVFVPPRPHIPSQPIQTF